MGEAFPLDHGPLAQDGRHAALAAALGARTRIDSPESFNAYCQSACRLWREESGALSAPSAPSARFAALLERIAAGGPDVIPTSWGGVVVTLHEPPRVEKYFVVRAGGYLALEKHEQKDERLEVREGAGLLLSRGAADGPLAVRAVAPGDEFRFAPGVEHCIIGADNLLVFERSVDPKGMDRDLVFLYEPA